MEFELVTRQPLNKVAPFKITNGESIGAFSDDGTFYGDVYVQTQLHFPDGSKMLTAGVPDQIDIGEF